MLAALTSGVLLGLSCGLSPGPLLTLLLAQTLRHGQREGVKVAMAPLITDLPVILVALAVAARASQLKVALGVLSFAGAAFVLYLAIDTMRPARPGPATVGEDPQSWFKGILTNLLSPHPWLFWMTVGAATLAKAMTVSGLAAAAFLAPFYLLLVGCKILVALLTARSRQFLAGRTYRGMMVGLGALLAIYAAVLFRQGWKLVAAAG